MKANPYAPPKAELADNLQDGTRPDLWNPGAAANWNLLFSPAFGAFLQMKNWEALGEPGKAAAAKKWVVLTLIVLALLPVATVLLANSKSMGVIPRLTGIVLLFGWYFSNGRGQMAYVNSKFGKLYPRRGWGKPILIAVLALVGFYIYAVVIILVGSTLNHGV
jgi:hypothetical protein